MNHMTRARFLRGDWREPSVPPSHLAVARIASNCLTYGGIHCHSCAETCEPEAIRFHMRVGATANPTIDLELCTGCGDCRTNCPVHAIELFKRNIDGDQT